MSFLHDPSKVARAIFVMQVIILACLIIVLVAQWLR